MSAARATILCIEDCWEQLILRKILLEANRYNVLVATDGSEGVRLLLTHQVDAVILDYHLRGTAADVVAAHMKLAKPHVPIILLSAYGPLRKSKLRSIDALVSKSQPDQVLSALGQLLNGSPKPFFFRWLDNWKSRNYGVRP